MTTIFAIMKLCLMLCLCMLNMCAAQKRRRPNIIFMMADQQRQDSIGAYPHSVGITPNLDSLASDGILFTNMWTSTPSCTPARAAILTGRSPWGHGMLGYGSISLQYPYELVHPLNAANYSTVSIGKNHFGFLNGTEWDPATHGYQQLALYDGLGSGVPKYITAKARNPLDAEHLYNQQLQAVNCTNAAYDDYDQYFQTIYPGDNPLATGADIGMDWNSWRGAPYIYNASIHPTHWVGLTAMQWLDEYVQHKQEKPFFLKISFHRPHSPYDPPQEYLDFVWNNFDLDRALNITHGNYWDSMYAVNNQYCGASHNDAWCGWMDNVTQTNMSRVSYYANVVYIDDMVGQILSKLKQLDLYDSSYILWTADHGDQLGDHNLWRKTYPYNSNAKIPMIIKWPTKSANTTFNAQDVVVKRGTVNNENVLELRDILPTVHNVSGVALPSNWSTPWSGLNINCVLYEGNECKWREWIDLEHNICYNVTNHWNALTDGKNYKYIFHAFFGNESLFDLSNDPNEYDNLVPQAVNNATLMAVLQQWRQRMVDMFEQQNRGTSWVQNGTLQQRQQGQNYGPNYPGDPAPCQ